MQKKDSLNLRECPFCGNKKLDVTTQSRFYELQGQYGTAAVCVRCWECSTDMYDHTSNEKNYEKRIALLTKKWNRRASDE